MKLHLTFIFLIIFSNLIGQYSPPAGQVGSIAIHKDSSIIISWATTATITRGYLNINDTTISINGNNKASFGIPSNATGPAEGNSSDIVSLGDRGTAILFFENGISNGTGYDFAIFENSFTDDFLELAFVEVSSNGIDFTRFPAISLTQTNTQTTSFGPTQSQQINNLAGSFRQAFGTPFDLEELQGTPNLDLMNIKWVKIIDVVGSIGANTSYDSQNNRVNDPYPTAFESGGFDLDGVGVMHEGLTNGINENSKNRFNIFPNPFQNNITIINNNQDENADLYYQILDFYGRIISSGKLSKKLELNLEHLPTGTYILEIENNKNFYRTSLIKN